MTTTTTNPYPNVAPPAGAREVDDWSDGNNEYRFVWGDKRGVEGALLVQPFAAQIPDGSFDLDGAGVEPPGVMIYERHNGQDTERLNITVHAGQEARTGTPRGCRRDRPLDPRPVRCAG